MESAAAKAIPAVRAELEAFINAITTLVTNYYEHRCAVLLLRGVSDFDRIFLKFIIHLSGEIPCTRCYTSMSYDATPRYHHTYVYAVHSSAPPSCAKQHCRVMHGSKLLHAIPCLSGSSLVHAYTQRSPSCGARALRFDHVFCAGRFLQSAALVLDFSTHSHVLVISPVRCSYHVQLLPWGRCLHVGLAFTRMPLQFGRCPQA